MLYRGDRDEREESPVGIIRVIAREISLSFVHTRAIIHDA
jgi:hypothetical protein